MVVFLTSSFVEYQPKEEYVPKPLDESNHFANEAVRQLAIEKYGGYEISEVLDMKTCDHCRTMHGKRYLWSEYEVGLTAPMFHNSCRGRIIPINKL